MSDVYISVCCCVKDEMTMLPDFVEHLGDSVDEYCFIDTGSTDGTLEFEHPKVRIQASAHFDKDTKPEDFDFSVARNEAVDMARGEWIANLDPDFRFLPEHLAELRNALGSDDTKPHDAVMLRVWSNQERVCRIAFFRNGLGIRFVGPVHEAPAVASYSVLYVPFVPIYHIRPYLAGGDDPRGEHYMRILLTALATDKDNPYLNALFAQELMNHGALTLTGRLISGVVCSARFDELPRTGKARAHLMLAVAMVHVGELELAQDQLELAHEETPEDASVIWSMGDIKRRRGDLDGAEEWFRKALACNDPVPPFLFDFPMYRGDQARASLEQIAELRKQAS